VKEETRYRVTGSLFLLALAVILLPMLLDGAGLPARELPALPFSDQLPEMRTVEPPPPESDFVTRVEKLREQVDGDGYMAQTGTRFGEPVLVPASARTDVWAVQVASFADAGNAEELRTRLRSDGYEAFISTAKAADGKVVSRVAVGPLLERARAQSLQQELSTRYAVKARLMDFSN
jgi:DedD protein